VDAAIDQINWHRTRNYLRMNLFNNTQQYNAFNASRITVVVVVVKSKPRSGRHPKKIIQNQCQNHSN
jgi:cAMP phosphodiesterase